MSKEEPFGGRLWTGNRTKESAVPAEKVLPLKAAAIPKPAQGDREYKAFETRDHAACIDIKCATGPSHYPAYSSLLNVIYDHHFGKAFTMVYSFMLVEITGSNLSPIVHAISFRNCERITEFHTKLHDRPAQSEPIVESVRITAAIKETSGREIAVPERA